MSRVRNHQVRTRRGAVTAGGMCAGAGQSRTHLRAHQLYTQSRRTTHTRLPSPMRTGNKLSTHKRRWAALAHRDLWPPPRLRGHMKAQTGPAAIVQRKYSLTALECLIDT